MEDLKSRNGSPTGNIMSLFSVQQLYCCICQNLFDTDFNCYAGYAAEAVCSKLCFERKQIRRTRAIMGKKYDPYSEVELANKLINERQKS